MSDDFGLHVTSRPKIENQTFAQIAAKGGFEAKLRIV
tara:strand:- start:1665 stop:1775 length:111 start_codon:yes stop_codon:yes gene_type:complete